MQPPQPPQQPLANGSSGKALASLICGILSFCLPIVMTIPAIILGVLSLRDIGRSGGRLTGNGLAIAGIVTGSVGGLIVGPIICAGALLVPAVQQVREAANRARSGNNMKQIAIALHNYHDSMGSFPPAVIRDNDGRPLYSWRVLLLPFLEEVALYRGYNLNEPWDSPLNRQFIPEMPKTYASPSDLEGAREGRTHYLAFVGPGAAFESDRPIRLADMFDGSSNTILFVEAREGVIWTKPQDLDFQRDGPLPRFEGFHSKGALAAFGDGAVKPIEKEIPEDVLRGLITRGGGEERPERRAAARPKIF